MKAYRVPNYLPDLLKRGATLKPGQVHHISIYHDAWCQIFQGKPCNCNPILRDGPPSKAA